jgi:hypothetical protein
MDLVLGLVLRVGNRPRRRGYCLDARPRASRRKGRDHDDERTA